MMRYEIQFGTDGWRAVIADRFTSANVAEVARAACAVARQLSKSRLLLVGYDRRFFSERFAGIAADVAAANGYRVEMSSEAISSPALSFHVAKRKAALGFMITASHNPYYFNGFKLKGAHGGSVDESVTAAVEAELGGGFEPLGRGEVRRTDMVSAYLVSLKKRVSLEAIRRYKGPFVFDGMHGPGGDLMRKLLGSPKNTTFIRSSVDPFFGGVNPEPIEKNLDALKEAVLANKAAAGLAVDGDADRVGVVDDKGRYLPPHTVMPLLLLHLIEDRRLSGMVAQTVSMGYLTERIAKSFSRPFEQTPVGFKHIAKKMGETKVLLGGEESGGYGVGIWSPERDGLLCALLLMEMLAVRKRPLSTIVDDIHTRFGASHFERVDFALPDAVNKTEWTERATALIAPEIGGQAVREKNTTDGLKVVLADDSWALLRPSGTEPLLRTYSEATSPALVAALLAEAKRVAELAAVPRRVPSDGSKNKKKKAARA